MTAFADRVNAALPVEQPDQILLALVESHRQATCGASCPRGQGVAEDGRCLPNALIAAAKKKPTPPQEATSARAKAPEAGSRQGPTPSPSAVASTPKAPARAPIGRMSLAGPPEPSLERPARARTPSSRSQPSRRRARPATPPRYADTRIRQRRHHGYSIPPGFPSWAIPAFLP